MDLSPVSELLSAGHAAIRIVTQEEPEVLEGLVGVAQQRGLEPWVWSSIGGLRPATLADSPCIENTENAAAAMVWLQRAISAPVMLVMLDVADYYSEPRVVRALRELIEQFRGRLSAAESQAQVPEGVPAPGRLGSCVVMIDYKEEVPPAIGYLSARWEVPFPDDTELEGIVRTVLGRLHRQYQVDAAISKRDFRAAVETLRGLTRRHAAELVRAAALQDRRFDSSDIPRLIDGKRRLLEDSGVLEFVDAPASLDDIGGLASLKRWLKVREASFGPSGTAKRGVRPPRGLLLLGVQGSGKSLCAKAIATAWRRPLMRLDPGTLFDRYVGESERRLREALRQAEAMSPVVLWIDEIEKGFASAASTSTDGGLSRRMFGTLLTWMQDRTEPVFVVATANDIEALPPELLRKGRFDEIFFVDLPQASVRAQIFGIHLRRAGQNVADFDLPELAEAAHGFSGAEIEQAVQSALHEASADGGVLKQSHVLAAVRVSPPLSVTMAEKVEALRRWSRGRCVPAD